LGRPATYRRTFLMEKNNLQKLVDPAVSAIISKRYPEIVADLGLDHYLDTQSAALLNALFITTRRKIPDISSFMGRNSMIIGPAAYDSSIFKIHEAENLILSDSAVSRYTGERQPDFIVTDLDGDLAKITQYSKKGVICLVHAHGDNMEQIMHAMEICPGPIIPTCQVDPDDMTSNFGGFTDGDRSAFFAHFLGSRRIRIAGFDFDSPEMKLGRDIIIKKRKLAWARQLLSDLYQIRTEKYGKENITYL